MDDLVNIIRLIRTENIGPKKFWNLINHFTSTSKAIFYLENKFIPEKKSFKIYSLKQAAIEIETALAKNIRILSYSEEDFPQMLRNIADCPPILFCLGNTSLLNKECISVIGSRNASVNGLRFAYKIAKELSEMGLVIVSGFARGIDTAAHKASLEGGTIAVLAGGIDHIYPVENAELYSQIIERGLLVAEMPLGTIPKSQNFPQRNRIISGLSIATSVIEASLKSGSLITARLALEQNRELFVVPGFPLDPHYQGNNFLLKQGAYLLEKAQDIEDILSSSKINKFTLLEKEGNFKNYTFNDEISEKELTQIKGEIINLLGVSPCSINELIRLIEVSPSAVITAIIELELENIVVRHFGNQISIKC